MPHGKLPLRNFGTLRAILKKLLSMFRVYDSGSGVYGQTLYLRVLKVQGLLNQLSRLGVLSQSTELAESQQIQSLPRPPARYL